MSKFIIQMLCNGELQEDNYDDLEFDTEEEAQECAEDLNSATSYGKETLQLSDPYEYEDEYDDDIEFVAVEKD